METRTTIRVLDIDAEVFFKNVKRMTVYVYRTDNRVELVVPYETSELDMIAFILNKRSWIKRKMHTNACSTTRVESFRAYMAGTVEVVRNQGRKMLLNVEAPFGNVKVHAPIEYTIEEMKEFVEENTDYIQERRAALRRRFPQGVEYESGYRLTLWGEPVELLVEAAEDNFGVKCECNVLHMRVREDASREVRRDWLRYFLGEQVIEKGVPIWKKYFELMDVEVEKFVAPYLTGSWSTCSFRTQRISLNADLARHPKFLLEYNIVFQLCNFVTRKNGGDFYDHLDHYYPDWRKAEEYEQKINMDIL